MADHMRAELMIGGPVPRRLIPELVRVVKTEYLTVDDDCFDADDEEEILGFVDNQDGLLCLANEEARYGAFNELETFLVENEIAFDRCSWPKYEFGGSIRSYRPTLDMNVEDYWNEHLGRIVARHELVPVLLLLESSKPDEARELLEKALAPHVPDLTPLRFVDG